MATDKYEQDERDIGRAAAVLELTADEHKIPPGDTMFAGVQLAVAILARSCAGDAVQFNAGMRVLAQELQMRGEAALANMDTQRPRAN
jgi:hypothetical protein